jgi:hypothetical protein
MLKDAKQNVARIIPSPRIKGLAISTPMNKPTMTGNTETRTPKRNEESTSPRKIVQIEIGEDMSLSKVFALASHGTIAGPTEVAVKKAVIPSNPGIRASTDMFRPI